MRDEQVAAAYDARAAEYIALIGSIEQLEDADVALIARWRDETPGQLLDAGCGPGLWTAFLAESGRDVIGADVSAEFLAAARAAHPGLRFEAASIRAARLPEVHRAGVAVGPAPLFACVRARSLTALPAIERAWGGDVEIVDRWTVLRPVKRNGHELDASGRSIARIPPRW